MKKYFLLIILCCTALYAQEAPAAVPATDSSGVYKVPSFPGGHQAFTREFIRNFRTAIPASQNIKKARVTATFFVNEDGSMSQFMIESSESDAVKNEFLKALKKITTKWTPAERNGKPVRAKMRQPLIFILE
ncbi:energy transducer TonB [Chryseobacterium sp. NRRL B-14859]|uniref:energy transducer TonB n=1 Tax=Chryseobacterium sp. NRRL B-14859 TaxID=1562763 RepID=UPI0033984AFE